jgi:branched-chain amino acid transport system substrate-binding protein
MLKALALGLPLALAVAACTGSGGMGGQAAGPVVIGATLPLTGSLSALGTPIEAGYEQEIADVNAAGGITIGGTKEKLRLIVLDNAGNPATAAAQADELARKDHAAALLGPATEQIVMPVADTAEELHVPFLTSQMPVQAFASGDKTGWHYSWDLFYSEQQQATAAAAALAAVPGAKKVALFTDDEPDSVTEQPLYEAAFKAAGLDLVGDYTFPAGTTDYSANLAQARAAGAQLVAGQLDPAGTAALARQLKSSAFRPAAAFLAGTPGLTVQDSTVQDTTAGRTLSDGDWSPVQAPAGQLAKISPTLGKKYAASPADYGTAALAYAVAEVLTDALAKADTTSPGKLTTAISKTDAPTTAGTIKFSSFTHTATTPYYVTGG